MHFTAILALCAGTALAANKTAIRVTSKTTFLKRRQVSMWLEGDAKPVAPSASAGCFTEASYWYDDRSFCWQEWDQYCGPNWDVDQQCEDIEKAYQESKNSTPSDCPVAPTRPFQECFTVEAFSYQSGTTCDSVWNVWDQYCYNIPAGCGQNPDCEQTNADYRAWIKFLEEEESSDDTTTDGGSTTDTTTDETTDPDDGGDDNPCGSEPVPTRPGEGCFTNDAYNYSDVAGDCAQIWRDWDQYCWNICSSDERCAQIEQDYNTFIQTPKEEELKPEKPIGECLNQDAWSYSSGTACDQIWKDWDAWCSVNNVADTAESEECKQVEVDYQAAISGTMVMRSVKQRSAKHLVLAKRAATSHARAQSNSGFNSGIAAGASIGAVSAAVILFAINRCAKKSTSDDFERV